MSKLKRRPHFANGHRPAEGKPPKRKHKQNRIDRRLAAARARFAAEQKTQGGRAYVHHPFG